VKLAKSPTVELTQLKQSITDFTAMLQKGTDEAFAVESLSKLVPEFRRDDTSQAAE
jgi:hypothetical protein